MTDRVKVCPAWTMDVCMCGMTMEDHHGYEGHSPVSMFDNAKCTERLEENTDD